MSELVAKTAQAIAVDESLTVLLDWVNIEYVSGFTIVVNNASGGSANDIADVQIDTSDDGGVTANLDQHNGVPAVPIASGQASQGTFTETAKFVRARAKCAAGQDTTATAILTADSAAGRLCTLADAKDRLGITETDHDVTINRIIVGLEGIFDNETGRPLILNAADVTEYYTGCASLLQVKRYPIVAVTSIKEAYDYDFASATALTENTDYRIINAGANGARRRVPANLPCLPTSARRPSSRQALSSSAATILDCPPPASKEVQ
ncbi:MAG: hypothetical protein ACYTEQ_31215 [Planctomycetota bacterium]|jgi:hypothetical protein